MPFFRILLSFYFLLGFASSNHPLNLKEEAEGRYQHKRSIRVGSSSVIKNHMKEKMKSDEPLSTLSHVLSQDLSVLASNHPLNRRKRQRTSNQHKTSRRVDSSSMIKNHMKEKMKSDEPS
ncbi:hypothetical protein GBA52_000040 [Prunus armeniaca]|nr:hypothetical protein GBA52_000040 [Prunus armeniaca]